MQILEVRHTRNIGTANVDMELMAYYISNSTACCYKAVKHSSFQKGQTLCVIYFTQQTNLGKLIRI